MVALESALESAAPSSFPVRFLPFPPPVPYYDAGKACGTGHTIGVIVVSPLVLLARCSRFS